jgi:hypothetical protein
MLSRATACATRELDGTINDDELQLQLQHSRHARLQDHILHTAGPVLYTCDSAIRQETEGQPAIDWVCVV